MYTSYTFSLGSISDLSLAGALSTGTHGHGFNHGVLASYVSSNLVLKEQVPQYRFPHLGYILKQTLTCIGTEPISTLYEPSP